ncbi:MAG: CBS domain-containing protein [Actinobacteria bacterium]|nr:MAG: CBS domain-containing protein [Actinomycetota bacterium]
MESTRSSCSARTKRAVCGASSPTPTSSTRLPDTTWALALQAVRREHRVVTISREDTLARAAELMSEHGVTHLLVVSRKAHPIGVVSTLDLARATASGLTDRARVSMAADPSPLAKEER